MRNRAQTILLLAVLAALIGDIAVHTRPVLAQSGSTLYIDRVAHHFIAKDREEVTIQGVQVVGFSCEGDHCYVISK